jgi:hypothetical protein
MKRMIFTCMGLFTATMLLAQSPAAIKYQAVARDATGAILANRNVGFRFSILAGGATGTAVFRETHSAQTNEFGLVILEIGNGTNILGNISSIDWGAGAHYLKIELDPNGGSSYSLMGTSQLLSVPYALRARIAETGDNWGGQFVITDATLAGNGTSVTPLKIADNGINSVKIQDGSIVTADLANSAVTGAKIAQGGATSGQALKWNGTAWAAGNDLTGITAPGGSGGHVQFNQSGNLGGDAAFFWDNTGKKLGIGTAAPAYPVHVLGTGSRSVYSETTNLGGIAVYGLASHISGENFGVIGVSGSSHGHGVVGQVTAAAGLNYGIKGLVASPDGFSGYFSGGKFYISGNTGIGTTTPGALLDVAGNAKVSGTLTVTEVQKTATGTANLIPIAYGTVSTTGAILSGTGNFSVTYDSTDKRYEITIDGHSYSYSQYAVSVTHIGSGSIGFPSITSSGGIMYVTFYMADGTKKASYFSFMVFKP